MSNSSPLINQTPINAIFNLDGVPLFTYVMIGITTVTLAWITMLDDSNKSFAKDEGFFNTLQTGTTSVMSGITTPFSGTSDKTPEPEPQPEPQPEESKGGKKNNRQTKSNIQKYKHNKSKRINISR